MTSCGGVASVGGSMTISTDWATNDLGAGLILQETEYVVEALPSGDGYRALSLATLGGECMLGCNSWLECGCCKRSVSQDECSKQALDLLKNGGFKPRVQQAHSRRCSPIAQRCLELSDSDINYGSDVKQAVGLVRSRLVDLCARYAPEPRYPQAWLRPTVLTPVLHRTAVIPE
jgi:hypothetical protein